MRQSKEEIGRIKTTAKETHEYCDHQVIIDLIDTIQALHTNIEALAKQYEDQGRVAEAKEIRGLVE